MVTIVSAGRPSRRPAPPSSFIRRLDELGPVLVLAAVLAILVAAAVESRPTQPGAAPVARLMAE